MPRVARVVHAGVPHHVTHRGNRGQAVFLDDQDRESYLRRLSWHAQTGQVRIGGWCLMSNHVHLVITPESSSALADFMKSVQGQHAQYMNDRYDLRGHLWDGRYYSVGMEEDHEVAAMLYVERNPVQAGIVAKADEYTWSSAQAHTTGVDPRGIVDLDAWRHRFAPTIWRAMLATASDSVLESLTREPTQGPAAVDEPSVRNALEAIARGRSR